MSPVPVPPRRIWISCPTTWDVFNFRNNLIRGFVARGDEVTSFSPADGYVERTRALGARHVQLDLDAQSTHPVRELIAVFKMWRTLRRHKPDLLLTFAPKINIYCSLAAAMAGVPVIANVSGLGRSVLADGWLKWVTFGLYMLTSRIPRKMFFQNADDRALFLNYHFIDEARTECIPGSGVDLSKFAPRRRAPRSEFVFLLVARLMWDKGVGEFIEAARVLRRRFPDVKFRLLGWAGVANPSSISADQVDEWVREGLVEFLGMTDDVPPVLGEADCVVLPSYREGVPRVLLEASAMAIPVITSDAPGCRDAVIDGVTGLVCAVRSGSGLAEKMAQMLQMTPAERARMGAAGRRFVESRFDEQIVVRRYLDAADEALRELPALRAPA